MKGLMSLVNNIQKWQVSFHLRYYSQFPNHVRLMNDYIMYVVNNQYATFENVRKDHYTTQRWVNVYYGEINGNGNILGLFDINHVELGHKWANIDRQGCRLK